MDNFQQEFNFTGIDESAFKIEMMQKQLDSMNESVGKVRKKLFGELSELKKELMKLKMENEFLQERLYEIQNKKKTDWVYNEGGYLFYLG